MDLSALSEVLAYAGTLAKEIGKGGGGSTEEPTVCMALVPVALQLRAAGPELHEVQAVHQKAAGPIQVADVIVKSLDSLQAERSGGGRTEDHEVGMSPLREMTERPRRGVVRDGVNDSARRE